MLPKGVKIDVRKLRFNVVKQAFTRLEVEETKDDESAVIVWWDGLMKLESFAYILPHQRVNKIPNMDVLCYKSSTFKSFNFMRKMFPKSFTFFPTTYILPLEFPEFQKDHIRSVTQTDEPVTWIFKPRAGCCGNGIKLVQNSFEVADRSSSGVIQRYIEPYLLDGFKFDFRFYVLISNVEPFTVFVYNEGLTRFCTQKYQKPTKANLTDKFSHLTNTSVNVGNKEASNDYLQSAMLVIAKIIEQEKCPDLWSRIKHVIMHAMIAIYPEILEQVKGQEYSMPRQENGIPFLKKYFHILGIDILLSKDLQPIVLELNDRPSMAVTFALENTVKTQLIYDALNIVSANGAPPDESAKPGGWEKVLPANEKTHVGKSVHAMMDKAVKSRDRTRIPRNVFTVTVPGLMRTSLPPLHATFQ